MVRGVAIKRLRAPIAFGRLKLDEPLVTPLGKSIH